jgi:hypothetical protein
MHPIQTRSLGIAGLVLLLGSGPSSAGPPNPTASDGLGNTAGGTNALVSNTTGDGNTAFGDVALVSNTTGAENTANGANALFSNTTGFNNTASGFNALFSNTTGGDNTASGLDALLNNTTGAENTTSGAGALFSNTTGVGNIASGFGALMNNTTGSGNIAVGGAAGFTNATGSSNTFIGTRADVFADGITNGTALGNGAVLFQSNSIVLGNRSISAIFADVSISLLSDRRRKKDIRALDADLGLDFIEKLEPVSYRFNNGDETERYGFVAQDLEGALPAALHDTVERSQPEHGLALIQRQNDKDRTYRVSYDELFAPIVKSIQEQQHEIAAERQQNAERQRSLEGQIAALQAQNEALRHSIDGVREQVAAR